MNSTVPKGIGWVDTFLESASTPIKGMAPQFAGTFLTFRAASKRINMNCSYRLLYTPGTPPTVYTGRPTVLFIRYLDA